MLRNLIPILTALVLWSATLLPAGADEISKSGDAFFAGSVVVISPTQITVSRAVRGKAESRSFTVTPQTKIEGKGKLAVKVRVTVRYISDDDGETATLIVVRSQVKK